MARIRTIKPEFFRHERLADLSPAHRLLFIGLWTLCDRFGRTEDRPKRIKAELLPYDKRDVDAMLDDLERVGFIVRYQIDGARYIAVPSFLEHQRINGKEAQAPETIPPPPMHTPGKQWGSNREAPETQPGRIGDDRKGKEGNGVVEGKGEDARPSVVPFDAEYGAMPTRKRNPALTWEGTREGLGVPHKLHRDLLSKMALPDEPALLDWYAETERAWQGKSVGDTCWQFWNKRFTEWQGATPTTKAAPASPWADPNFGVPARFRNGGAA